MVREVDAISEDITLGTASPDPESTIEALIKAHNNLPRDTDLSDGQLLSWNASEGVLEGVDNGAYAVEKIATASGTGASGTITFASIPQTYRHLQIVGSARLDGAGAASVVLLRFNGDSSANYDWQLLRGNDTTVLASAAVAQNAGRILGATAVTAPANEYGNGTIDIPDYTGPQLKSARGNSVYRYGTSVGELRIEDFGAWWDSVAAITSVSLVANSGNFTSDTVFDLYGIKAGA